MDSIAIQLVFNLLISLAVLGFVLYRQQFLREIMPVWTLLTPPLLIVVMQIESLVAAVYGFKNVFVHHVLFLLLVTSLLILAWHLPVVGKGEGEKK